MHPRLRAKERKRDLRPLIEQRMAEEYGLMKQWLPKSASNVLDIGCGDKPWIDVWLAQHYGNQATIHLMDGEARIPPKGKEQVNFHKRTMPWKSRYEAVEFMRERAPDCRTVAHPADPSLTIPCEVIVSRRSWGHHYAIETYLDLAMRSLNRGGRLIVDIRGRTDGLRTLEGHGFHIVSPNIEARSVKCQRFVLERP